MILVDAAQLDLFLLDDVMWLLTTNIGVPNYDFAFASFLPCRRPWARPERLTAIGRFGGCDNYAELFATLASDGIQLIHTPEQHLLASELTQWYPQIAPLTPRSAWFTHPPRVEEIEHLFAWPVFIKGSRQTSRHQAALSIVRSPHEYEQVVAHYRRDPILRWQPLVCREFIPLRPVHATPSEVIPPSFELINIAPERLTVEIFLTNWLEEVMRRRLRPRVYANYEQIVRTHLVPHLGAIQLVKLTPERVYAVLAQLADARKAANTIRNVRAVLRRALNQALRWGKVHRNVAALVELPRPATGSTAPGSPRSQPGQMHVLSPAQAPRLLDAVAGHRWDGVYRVALELGLRRGEILALRWADIDFERKVLAVTGTIHRHSGKLQRDAPKTEASRRLLPLTDTLAAALLEHKARQDAERESLGDSWVDLDLVFTTGHGTAIEPHNLFDHFKAALQKAGLPDMRFHDLRHSCASILLAQNVHPRVIMEILGHSEIGTTMNLYAHVVPEVQESAVQLLSQALAPKAKLARIEYERYDAEGKLIDSDMVEQEIDLALMGRLSPKGWSLKARLIAQDGQAEERVYTCGRADQKFNNDIRRGILRRDATIDIVRVQDAGLTTADDPTVLAWAAQTGRVLLTHDVATITHYAYEHVRAGQPMPGVFEVSRTIPLAHAIDDIILIATCSLEGEWEGQVRYLPLR